VRNSAGRFIAVFAAFIMIAQFSQCIKGFAQGTKTADSFAYDVTVSERNGVSVKHHMIKRGIPVVSGQVMPDDKFVAVDSETKEEIPIYTKALEKYENGSVSWLMLNFFVDLSANQTREFTVKKAENIRFEGKNIEVTRASGEITVSNGIIGITVDKGGLKNITYKNSALLRGNGTNAFYSVQNGERITAVGSSVEVYEETPNYVTIKSVSMASGGMTFEQLYTVYRNSGRIGNMHRTILSDGELSGYIFVDSIGQEFLLSDDFSKFTNGGKDVKKLSSKVTLSRGTDARAYSADKNISLGIVSRDAVKFAGVAGNLGVVNGFVSDSGNRTLTFAPLVYRTGGPACYKWYDGIGRTFHSDIIISDGENAVNYDDEYATIDNPPYVGISPQRYVDTGWLGSAETAPIMDRKYNTVLKTYNNVRLGRLDTGSLTYEIAQNGMIKGIAQRPAKIEYYAWHDQMNRNSAEYFDIISESVETYADICIYRGANKIHRGAGRYRNYFNDSMQFENWQCYYTTPDGMYIGYLMTGNEYLKDTIKLHYDYALEVSLIAKQMIKDTTQTYGKALVTPGEFEKAEPIEDGFQIHGETLLYNPSDKIRVISTTATRFAVHAKSAYYAYRLFEDEKYLGITKGYIDWLDYYQMPNGRLASGYLFNGQPDIYNNDPKHIVTSNYILLYGLRPVNDLFRFTSPDDEMYKTVDRNKMRKVLIGLADWLIEDMTPAGDTWTMSDPETAAIDGSRGCSGAHSQYAAEILYTAYNETKDIKYLENFCKMFRAGNGYMEDDGFAGEVYTEQYKLCQMGTFYIPFFRENEKLIKQLGYSDLVDIFLNKSDIVAGEFKALNPKTPVSGNIWSNGKSKAIYMNYSNYERKENYNAEINTGDSFIYEGVPQIVNTGKTTVLTPTFMPFDNVLGRDAYTAKRTMVKVLEDSVDVKADVIRNTDNETVILLQAENGIVNLALCDAAGDYSIDVKYQAYRNSKILTIKKGGNIAPVDGKIQIAVDFSDGNSSFTLPRAVIQERTAPVQPVHCDDEGFYPAWMPYSPVQSTYLLNPTGDKASFSFTAKPLYNEYDTKIAYFSNENNVAAVSDFQFEFLFGANGTISAIDGDKHKCEDTVKYELGGEYRFDVTVDVKARKYSAVVTAPDGKTYTLANDYEFRYTSAPATTIDAVVLVGRPDSLVVKNHSLAK